MIVLGIGDSHEAHACLIKDGELVAAMGEERLSRLKSDMGYPRRSIDSVLGIANISPDQIDCVAFAGLSGQLFQTLYKCCARFTVKDWIKQCHEYWKPLLIEGKNLTPFDDVALFRKNFPDIALDPYYSFLDLAQKSDSSDWDSIGQEIRAETVQRHLGVDRNKIKFFRHEDCHKLYGYYSNQNRIERALVFTVEGGGDDSSATVSTISNNELTEHWKSNDVMIGRLYRYVTLILGMLPAQHEYKVMGLAPYGNEYHGSRSLEFFRTIDSVVGCEIINSKSIPDLYFSVKDALEGERFDGIAWGLQSYLEETLCLWIKNNIAARGINDVILSGGVAQNIKAIKAIADMSEVASVWSGPITGDGSLGIGAAWMALSDAGQADSINKMSTAYLGTSASQSEVEEAIYAAAFGDDFLLHATPKIDTIAKWLDDGNIIARFSGKMEFGQRALGNRSILADPRKFESVERINSKVKFRDFWMPFTPSMTVEDAEKILHNPKNIFSPFMTMAFDLNKKYETSIPAVVHPADKTARPQMLRRLDNPAYYDILRAFKERSGIGILLNTSFNLHGEAIVETPHQAIDTFMRSDLDILLFDHVAIERKR